MKEIVSKSSLAVILSNIEDFHEPKVRLEQYLMDSEIGAYVLWSAYLLGDIESKSIADLGCGTGILGIGATILGARYVFFVDSDKKALKIVKDNIWKLKSEGYDLENVDIICSDIRKLSMKTDVVIQNPPFGTKVKHSDIVFLKKAMEISPIVYSFHKSENKIFLEQFCVKNDAKITHAWDFRFPLKARFIFHRRRIKRINVSCFRFETLKNKDF